MARSGHKSWVRRLRITALEVHMTVRLLVSTIAIGVACSTLVGAGYQGSQATQKPKPTVAIPNPGVPQIMTLEDRFVRISYNNEGYVTMGYRLAEWLAGQGMDQAGCWHGVARGRAGVQAAAHQRVALTPTGDVPLPTQTEYSQADLRGLDHRPSHQRRHQLLSAQHPRRCRIGFFSELGSGTSSFNRSGAQRQPRLRGRAVLQDSGWLKLGQHFLNVQFKNSKVRVPFRILTKEEEQFLNKNWKDIKKQVDEAFKKGGK
jgi:hypothetical protein